MLAEIALTTAALSQRQKTGRRSGSGRLVANQREQPGETSAPQRERNPLDKRQTIQMIFLCPAPLFLVSTLCASRPPVSVACRRLLALWLSFLALARQECRNCALSGTFSSPMCDFRSFVSFVPPYYALLGNCILLYAMEIACSA